MRDDERMVLPARSRRGLLTSAAVLLVLGVTGCGSASAPSPPTGVDGLVIPTPEADPDDFVDAVDNPWFPLAVGSSWEYDADPVAPGPTLTATAVSGPTVAGISTTTLVRVVAAAGSRGGAAETRDHYAQDRAGNVWWLGREGEWRAGTDGAQAGLVMPAEPRLGDGFAMGRTASLVARARVLEVEATVTVPLGAYQPVVVLEVTEGAQTRRESYARGIGLVQRDRAGLVANDRPR